MAAEHDAEKATEFKLMADELFEWLGALEPAEALGVVLGLSDLLADDKAELLEEAEFKILTSAAALAIHTAAIMLAQDTDAAPEERVNVGANAARQRVLAVIATATVERAWVARVRRARGLS